jgi:signal transduction histidine kinase
MKFLSQITAIHRSQLLSMLLMLAYFGAQPAAQAQGKDVRRVLVLTERAAPAVTLAVQEIEGAFLEPLPFEVQVYTESLEAVLFSEPGSVDEQRRMYAFKYRTRKPDVIIALGPTPLKLLATDRKTFFPDVPIVFCGSTREQADHPVLDANFTGTWMSVGVRDTVQNALRLQPGIEHLAIVGGRSSYDQHVEQLVKAGLAPFGDRLEMIDLTQSGMPALLERVSKLPGHTAILFTSFLEDADGRHFRNNQSVPLITGKANAPTYGLADTLIGWGIVGGNVVSFADQGKIAAKDAKQMLLGKKPNEIPIVEGPRIDVFDWRQLQRWHISEASLPAGSVVLYRQATFWEKYKWVLISALVIGACLSLLILYLYIERERRRRTEVALAREAGFQSLLSDLSSCFIDLEADKIEAGIDLALDRLSHVLEVERIKMFEFVHNTEELLCTHRAMKHGKPLPVSTLLRQDYTYTFSKLSKNEPLIVADIDQFAEMPVKERELMKDLRIRAGVFLPLETGGTVFGALSFVSSTARAWPPELMKHLKMLAQIFANALIRKRTNEALQTSELLKDAILSSLRGNVVVASSTGEVISSNSWIESAFLTGLDKSEAALLPGTNCLHVYGRAAMAGDGTAREILGGARRVLEGDMVCFELEWTRELAGAKKWFSTSVTPLETNGGGIVITHTEITNRKEAEEERLELSGRLIDMQEKERSRLARELHDDFNQRLAVLAIDLERAGQAISASPAETGERLHELWTRASEIGADLHTLSHRLHSSTLESLGLVLGVSSLCAEFAEQQGIEVHFTHNQIPRNVPPDVALCLFRIAQESLRNVKRHSGASSAEVSLNRAGNEITLTIADQGRGFDMQTSQAKVGLGLRSMRERLRLLKGRIEIKSGPGEGTVIRVWVPLSTNPGEPSRLTLVSRED